MSENTRIGFIGCGGMARAHADALAGIDGVAIAALTDVDGDKAKALAATLKDAQVYDTPGDLVRKSGVDCVFILLPPFAHGVAERSAISAKVPFFIEKPVGLNPTSLRELSKEVQQAGLMTSAGYMNRYRRSVNTAKEMLQKDPAALAYGGWFGGPPGPSSSGIGLWWSNKDKSGGQFHEQVTHTVDLARYLLGDAIAVSAFAANGFNERFPNYTMDDAAVVNIQFASGAVANLMSSVASRASGGVLLNVYAKDHAFEFTGWEHTVKIRRVGESEGGVIKGEDNIFRIEDQVFIDAVRAGDPSKIRCTYPDGVKTALLSIGANESIANGGKPVSLRE